MKQRCPSINELLAFEAAARYLSMALAARELCVTPSAVSRQLSSLESYLGVELFDRKSRHLALTSAGAYYLKQVQPLLQQLEQASNEIRVKSKDASTLNVSCVPTFLTKWLIPRLAGFSKAHPHINLAFSQHLSGMQPQPYNIHLAIRYGKGNWPDVCSDEVVKRQMVVIGAPHPGVPGPTSMAALAKGFPLLVHQEEPESWQQWFQAFGQEAPPLHRCARFEHYNSLISAVAAGIGYAVVPRCLVENELNEGKVVELFCREDLAEAGHFLCYRAEQLSTPSFQVFRQWLLQQGGEGGLAG